MPEYFYAGKTVDSELTFILRSVETLYHKAFYKSATKKLSRGIKLALKHEKIEFLLQLYHWQHHLLEKENYENFGLNEINTQWEKEQKAVATLSACNRLWHIKNQVFKMLYYNGSRTKANMILLGCYLKKTWRPVQPKMRKSKEKFSTTIFATLTGTVRCLSARKVIFPPEKEPDTARFVPGYFYR